MRKINGIACNPRVSEIGHEAPPSAAALLRKLNRWLKARGLGTCEFGVYGRGKRRENVASAERGRRINSSIARVYRGELSREQKS